MTDLGIPPQSEIRSALGSSEEQARIFSGRADGDISGDRPGFRPGNQGMESGGPVDETDIGEDTIRRKIGISPSVADLGEAADVPAIDGNSASIGEERDPSVGLHRDVPVVVAEGLMPAVPDHGMFGVPRPCREGNGPSAADDTDVPFVTLAGFGILLVTAMTDLRETGGSRSKSTGEYDVSARRDRDVPADRPR